MIIDCGLYLVLLRLPSFTPHLAIIDPPTTSAWDSPSLSTLEHAAGPNANPPTHPPPTSSVPEHTYSLVPTTRSRAELEQGSSGSSDAASFLNGSFACVLVHTCHSWRVMPSVYSTLSFPSSRHALQTPTYSGHVNDKGLRLATLLHRPPSINTPTPHAPV